MPTPHDQQIISTLRKVDLKRLDRVADERDMSRAALIREYVLEGLHQWFLSLEDEALRKETKQLVDDIEERVEAEEKRSRL